MGKLVLSCQLVLGENEIIPKKCLAPYLAFYKALDKHALTITAYWPDAGHTSVDHPEGEIEGAPAAPQTHVQATCQAAMDSHDGHSHPHLPPPKTGIRGVNCRYTEGARTRESKGWQGCGDKEEAPKQASQREGAQAPRAAPGFWNALARGLCWPGAFR